MKLSNISYDRLKWFALVFVPAFEVLILTLGDMGGIDFTDLNRPFKLVIKIKLKVSFNLAK